jgi:hypothetical protein
VRISFGIDDTESKEIEFGTAVHGAFDQLQAVYMSFDWAVTPRVLQGGKDGSLVHAEVLCEAGQQARFGAFFPVFPSDGIPLPNDANELPCHRSAGGDFR